jgi:hypothetical protein
MSTLSAVGIVIVGMWEWFDPGGNHLPRFRLSRINPVDFSRSAFIQQVRLNHRNNTVSPTGAFECGVPSMGGGAQLEARIGELQSEILVGQLPLVPMPLYTVEVGA